MVASRLWSMVHDMSLPLPRTVSMVAHCVADTFGTTSGSESQVVFHLPFCVLSSPQPRTFLIVFYLRMLDYIAGI